MWGSPSPGRNKNEGTAQIGTIPENPQTYGGGALLANGALLKEIHRDYVILTRGDRSAKLELYRRDTPVRGARNELLQVGGQTEALPLPAPTVVALTSYVRPSPVFSGETLRGYEVYSGPKSGVFSSLGLQAGDVITALDDTPLNDPEQAKVLFDQLTQGAALVATIDRKGTRRRITLDGTLIIADLESAQNAVAEQPPPALPPG